MKNDKIAGVVLILVGIVVYLVIFDILSFSLLQSIAAFWPLGLVFMGIALMLNSRLVASIFLVLTVLLGLAYVFGEPGDIMPAVMKVADTGIDTMTVDLVYGAGSIEISKGNEEFLLVNEIRTRGDNPILNTVRNSRHADISIEKAESWSGTDSWDIELSSDVLITNISIDYGAADLDMDLRGLAVSELHLTTGASDTEIVFDNYPTKAYISAGAADIDLRFPKDANVKMAVEGGLTSVDGIEKDGAWYKREGSGNTIEVYVTAGATSINVE